VRAAARSPQQQQQHQQQQPTSRPAEDAGDDDDDMLEDHERVARAAAPASAVVLLRVRRVCILKSQPRFFCMLHAWPPTSACLQNLVAPGDAADADLGPETADECARFGAVLACVVHVRRGPHGGDVGVFVQFGSAQHAAAAVAIPPSY
jgi:hypothetical protein